MSQVGNGLAILVVGMAFLLVAGGGVYFAMMVKGCYVLRHWRRTNPYDHAATLLKSPLVPDVAVLMVSHEPSPEAFALVRRLETLECARHEVILVLDGQSETALEKWKQELHLAPARQGASQAAAATGVRSIYETTQPYRLMVLDKAHGSTADALNAGVSASSCPAIALLDPRSEFAAGILLRLTRPMLEEPDETVVVCGSVPVPPGHTLASRFGALESLRHWLGRSLAWAGWNVVVPWPGDAMIIEREALIQAGGFGRDKVDLLLTLRSAKPGGKPARVVFMPEVDSRPAASKTVDQLRSTVERDQQTVLRAIDSQASPRLLRLGLVWEYIMRPVLETVIYPVALAAAVLGAFSIALVELVLLATVLNGIMLSMTAVVLRELAEPKASDPRLLSDLFLAGILESCGYRQRHNLWLLRALWAKPKAPE